MLSDLCSKIKIILILLLFTALQAGVAYSQDEKVFEPYELLKKRMLERINEYHNYSFVTIIGIDTSGSMTSKNQLNNARKLSSVFIQENLIPGDEFYLFHFGPEPYPYYDKTLIPLDLRPAIKEIGKIQAKLFELSINKEEGTDLNYSLYHALSIIEKDKNKNYLIILLTDNNIDKDAWIKEGDNANTLDHLHNLVNSKGREYFEPVTEDKSLWAFCAYYAASDKPIPPVEGSDVEPSPGSNPRTDWVENIKEATGKGDKIRFTVTVLDSETRKPVSGYDLVITGPEDEKKVEPTGSGQYFLAPGPYSIEVMAEDYDIFEGGFEVLAGSEDISREILMKKIPPSSPVWILFLFLFLIVAGLAAFLLTRPLPVTVDITPGGDEKQFILKMNDFLLIGGGEDGGKHVFSSSGLSEQLVRVTHILPRNLRIDRLSGDGAVKILVSGETELKSGSAPMGSYAQIEFLDRISGGKSTINITKGTQNEQFQLSPSAGGGRGDDMGGDDDWMG